MNKYTIKTNTRKMLADTLTPVSIYLRLRDKFAQSILLESSDYHGAENSFSYICCAPIASFTVRQGTLDVEYPGGATERGHVDNTNILDKLEEFKGRFVTEESEYKFITNGLFGYMAYDSIKYFEDISLSNTNNDIPDMIYKIYRYVIVIDHFKNELYLFEHKIDELEKKGNLGYVESLINVNNNPQFDFNIKGREASNYSDEEFLQTLTKGRGHCLRGDVFQIVLSRRFEQRFQGDEFNVYRALRSINPSPYLFYFDYGDFKIFGSSPESQIVIKDAKASIYPIAGTFKRTGNDMADAELAQQLASDEKENAEHVMLVDLARNDLSRASEQVAVDVFKEVQYYSHVIHLVSKVTGRLTP